MQKNFIRTIFLTIVIGVLAIIFLALYREVENMAFGNKEALQKIRSQNNRTGDMIYTKNVIKTENRQEYQLTSDKKYEFSYLFFDRPFDSAERIYFEGEILIDRAGEYSPGDGMAIVMITNLEDTNQILTGGSIAASDAENILGFEIDTFQNESEVSNENLNDPKNLRYHWSIFKNHIKNHEKFNINPYSNIEGKWVDFKFDWNGINKTLTVIFDNQTLIQKFPKYAQNRSVYLGMVASTGTFTSKQMIRFNENKLVGTTYDNIFDFALKNRTVRTTIFLLGLLAIIVYTILVLTSIIIRRID